MTRAAVYCRISKDDEGRELGVTRQREDCEALAARLGLEVVDTYTDNDIGASTRSRKPRPEYARMLADARAGRFDVILAYTNSRLTRRPMELEALIQLHEKHGTRLQTVASGSADLSTADGRQYARIQASIDAGEAERTAERVARAALQSAQAGGNSGGPRAFGWAADKVSLDPTEAALLRQAVADVLDGRTTHAIVREWNAAGIKTARGIEWSAQNLRTVLRSPRLAGWRVYQGGIAVDKQGQPVRGRFEPLLEDAEWRAVIAALTTPAKRSVYPRRGARQYLLSGLMRCAECGQVMFGCREDRANGRTTHVYSCSNTTTRADGAHSNTINGETVEQIVVDLVISASELITAVPIHERTPERERIDELQANIAAHDEMIDDIMAAYRARQISAATAFKNVAEMEESRDRIAAERDELEATERGTARESVDRASWEGMDVERRRAVCERWLDAVYVRKPARRSSIVDPARIEIAWKNT